MSLSSQVLSLISNHVRQAPAEYSKWLEKQRVPKDIKDDLIQACFYGGTADAGENLFSYREINAVRFLTPESIMSENKPDPEDTDSAFLGSLIKYSLVIGSAINGDVWAINLKTGEVDIISHEESYFSDEESLVVFVTVAKNYSDFILKAYSDELHEDYYDAKEMQDFVREKFGRDLV
jgi:hypothetical protein